MGEKQILEGSREEVQEQLRAFPKEQRFRLVLLPPLQEQGEVAPEEPSLAELFAGRVGRFHFGDANLSRDSGGKFTALIQGNEPLVGERNAEYGRK